MTSQHPSMKIASNSIFVRHFPFSFFFFFFFAGNLWRWWRRKRERNGEREKCKWERELEVKLFFWFRDRLGVSKQTRSPINPPNPADPAWKPSEPTPATVGSGSLPIKPETGGSVDGFEHEKPRKTDPTGKLFRISILRRFEWLPVWFCPLSSSYTEILLDLFEI